MKPTPSTPAEKSSDSPAPKSQKPAPVIQEVPDTAPAAEIPSGAPVIVNTKPVAWDRTDGFRYQIEATNKPNHYGAVNLPKGLVLDVTSGVIAGVEAASGKRDVTIWASNSKGRGEAVVVFET